MARDFGKAALVINNIQKVIGTYHAPFGTTLFFDIGEEYNTLVAPLLVGIWDVPGVDQFEMMYYWLSSDDGDGIISPSFYITENTECSGEIPSNYNKTPLNGGPSTAEADKIYNALRTRLEELTAEHIAAEAAVVEEQFDAHRYLTEGVPENMKTLKHARHTRLLDCDWTQMADSPLTDEKKAEWAAYRTLLRDLPAAQTDDPYDPENFTGWPTKPS